MRRAGIQIAVVAALVALAGCGEDRPTADQVAQDADDAKARLASALEGAAQDEDGDSSGEIEEIIATLDDVIAAAGEVEGEEPEDVVASVDATKDAAVEVEDVTVRLAEAREAVDGSDRYEPSLADTASTLKEDLRTLVEVGRSLRTARVDELDEALSELEGNVRETVIGATVLGRPHPVGPLRADGIGKLTFGLASVAAAQREFGPPDRVEEVNFGLGPPPRFDWLYSTQPDFRLVFDAATDKLAGYQCESKCALETQVGIGVGDSMAAVRREFGGKLEEYALGTGALILPASGGQGSGGLIFTSDPSGGDDVFAISAFDTLAGPAGD